MSRRISTLSDGRLLRLWVSKSCRYAHHEICTFVLLSLSLCRFSMTSVGILPSVCNDTVFPHCFSSRFSTIHFMGFLVALALLRTLLSFLRASLSSFLYHVPDPRTVLLINFPKYATSIQYAYSLIPHSHSCPPFPAVLVAFSIIHEALSLQVSPSSELSLPA